MQTSNHDAHVETRKFVQCGYPAALARSTVYLRHTARPLTFGDTDPYADWKPEEHNGWRGD
jgi:hypothetical protein